MKQIFLFATLSVFIFSCGNESSEKPADKTEENKDPVSIEEETETIETNSSDESNLEERKALAAKTDEWIKKISKRDTVSRKFTFAEPFSENGDPLDVLVFGKDANDFDYISINTAYNGGSIEYQTFYFDENGLICQTRHEFIGTGTWQDDDITCYYLKDGKPYWARNYHIYKGETTFDSSWVMDEFEGDGLMFFEKNHVVESIISR